MSHRERMDKIVFAVVIAPKVIRKDLSFLSIAAKEAISLVPTPGKNPEALPAKVPKKLDFVIVFLETSNSDIFCFGTFILFFIPRSSWLNPKNPAKIGKRRSTPLVGILSAIIPIAADIKNRRAAIIRLFPFSVNIIIATIPISRR